MKFADIELTPNVRLVDVTEDPDKREATSKLWRRLSENQTLDLKGAHSRWCRTATRRKNPEERIIVFQIQRDGEPVGAFGLYRIRRIDRVNGVIRISALPAPLIPRARTQAFWRVLLGGLKWFLDNEFVDTETGARYQLMHWRFPNPREDDPVQHQWPVAAVQPLLDRFEGEYEVRTVERPDHPERQHTNFLLALRKV